MTPHSACSEPHALTANGTWKSKRCPTRRSTRSGSVVMALRGGGCKSGPGESDSLDYSASIVELKSYQLVTEAPRKCLRCRGDAYSLLTAIFRTRTQNTPIMASAVGCIPAPPGGDSNHSRRGRGGQQLLGQAPRRTSVKRSASQLLSDLWRTRRAEPQAERLKCVAPRVAGIL